MAELTAACTVCCIWLICNLYENPTPGALIGALVMLFVAVIAAFATTIRD